MFRWALLPAVALGLMKLRVPLVAALWTANAATALTNSDVGVTKDTILLGVEAR